MSTEELLGLQEVKRAADAITKNEVQQLKPITSPPIALAKICGMTSELLTGKGNNEWKDFKKACTSPPALIDAIKNFDATSLSKEQIKLLKDSKGDPDIDPEKVEKVNKAAAGLAHWIKALQGFVDDKDA